MIFLYHNVYLFMDMRVEIMKFLSKNDIVIDYVMMILCLFNVLACDGTYDDSIVKTIEIELLVVYGYVLHKAYKVYGFYDIKTLFLVTLGLFSFVRVFFTILGLDNYMILVGSLHDMVWTNDTAVHILSYYVIFLTVYHIGLSLSSSGENNTCIVKEENNRKLLALAKKIFIISLPLQCVYKIIIAIQVLTFGLSALYAHSLGLSGPMVVFFKIGSYIFIISYMIICMEEREIKKFDRYSLIYLLTQMIQMVNGQRGQVVGIIICIIFLRYLLFGKKVGKKTIILLLIIGIPLLYSIQIIRDGGTVSEKDLSKSFPELGKSLSISLNVASYYYQYRSQLDYNEYPYVLDPIYSLYFFIINPELSDSGQSLETISYRYSLNHQMTYTISKEVYLSGGGTGSNFIAEFSEFGILGVILGSIIIFIIIKKYSNNILRYRYLRFMSLNFVQYILFIPRAEAFYSTYDLVKWSIIYFVVLGVGKMILKGKLNESRNIKSV